MIPLEPKPRTCSVELPVLADLVFEAHRSSLLALCALLQGVFLLLFPLFLRVPSCADVAGPPNDSAQSLTLWTLQVLGILLSLFSNNKYASALWLLLALAISIPTVLLLIDLDVQYCRASALMDAGLDGTVLSSLSTSLPSSVPQLVIAVPTTVVLLVSGLNLALAGGQMLVLLFLCFRDIVFVLQAVLTERSRTAWRESRRLVRRPRWQLLAPWELAWLAAAAGGRGGEAEEGAQGGSLEAEGGEEEGVVIPDVWRRAAGGSGARARGSGRRTSSSGGGGSAGGLGAEENVFEGEGAGGGGFGGGGGGFGGGSGGGSGAGGAASGAAWRIANGDAIECARELQAELAAVVAGEAAASAAAAAARRGGGGCCWGCCGGGRSSGGARSGARRAGSWRSGSSSASAASAASSTPHERSACEWAREACAALPLRLLVGLGVSLMVVAVATLWMLGPLRLGARAASASLAGMGSLSCAGVVAPARPDLADACRFFVASAALLRPLTDDLEAALTWGALLSAVLCALNACSALPAFLADHALLVALRARRGAALSGAVMEELGLSHCSAPALEGEAAAAAAAEAAAAAAAAAGGEGGSSINGGQRGGGGGWLGAGGGGGGGAGGLAPLLLLSGAGALPPPPLHQPPLYHSSSGSPAPPPHPFHEPSATALAAWRLGLDLLPLAPGTTRLHSLPAHHLYAHTLAWDYVPSAAAGALSAHALLTGVLTCGALLTARPGLTQSVCLLLPAVSVVLVLARGVAYSALSLVLARASASASAASARPAAVRLALSRHFMLGDTLAAFSPVSYAAGAAGALLRLLLGALFWPLSLQWLHRPFACLGALDPAFAAHAGMARVAFLDQTPPGYQSVGAARGGKAARGGGGGSANPWEEGGGAVGGGSEGAGSGGGASVFYQGRGGALSMEGRGRWEGNGGGGDDAAAEPLLPEGSSSSSSSSSSDGPIGPRGAAPSYLWAPVLPDSVSDAGAGGVGGSSSGGAPKAQVHIASSSASGSSAAPRFSFPAAAPAAPSAAAGAAASFVAGAVTAAAAAAAALPGAAPEEAPRSAGAGGGGGGAAASAESAAAGEPQAAAGTELALVPENGEDADPAELLAAQRLLEEARRRVGS